MGGRGKRREIRKGAEKNKMKPNDQGHWYRRFQYSMVITYVYAKNSAPLADRGFLNDVQNTNSNCDITM